MKRVALLDLGYGNTHSVALAFRRLGCTVDLVEDRDAAATADRLVLPGVGAAAAAMRALGERDLVAVLRERTAPTLGICLGMQLLFASSEEDGGTPLIGRLPGNVTRLRPEAAVVPHMGWSRLTTASPDTPIGQGSYMYFAHSYRCPDHPSVIAVTHYGGEVIPAALRDGPVWGVQFHPERSAEAGAALLEAFVAS